MPGRKKKYVQLEEGRSTKNYSELFAEKEAVIVKAISITKAKPFTLRSEQ